MYHFRVEYLTADGEPRYKVIHLPKNTYTTRKRWARFMVQRVLGVLPKAKDVGLYVIEGGNELYADYGRYNFQHFTYNKWYYVWFCGESVCRFSFEF